MSSIECMWLTMGLCMDTGYCVYDGQLPDWSQDVCVCESQLEVDHHRHSHATSSIHTKAHC